MKAGKSRDEQDSWEGMSEAGRRLVSYAMLGKMMTPQDYRCQFCGKDSPVGDWGGPSEDICPQCGKTYDPILAQEEETE